MGLREISARAKENSRYGGTFAAWAIRNGELHPPLGQKVGDGRRSVPIGGASASFEGGDSQQKTTGGRVLTGALIAGPAGAIVGGLLKKEKGKVYATIVLPDESVAIIEGKKADESKLRQFVAKVNAAGRWYADHEFDDGSFHKK